MKLEELEIEITGGLDKIEGNLNGLKKTLTMLKGLTKALTGFNSSGISNISKLAEALDKLSAVQGISEVTAQLKQISKIDYANLITGANGVSQLASSLERLSQAANSGTSKAIKDTANAAKNAAKGAGSGGNAQNTAKNSETEQTQPSTEKSSGGDSSFFKNLAQGASAAASKVSSVLTPALQKCAAAGRTVGKALISGTLKTAASPWVSLKDKIMSATQSLSKFFGSFGRVAMFRAMQTAISTLTKGFQEGMQNVYDYGQTIGGTLTSSFDSAASSSLYLKNSLGAVAVPIMNILAPAIDFVIGKLVSLINMVNQFFSVLSGASSWTKAVRVPQKFGTEAKKSGKKAKDAAKDMKDYTMSFDELNVLSKDKDKSGSGSGSGGGADVGSMFEQQKVDASKWDWVTGIKDAISNGDWSTAGSLLADKVNSVVDGIDAEGFGQKLGGKIQNGIDFANGFMGGMNWSNLGATFASGLNGVMDSINGESLGQLIANKFNAAIQLAAGFATTFDWSDFGTTVANTINGYFSNLDTETLKTGAVALGKGIADSINNMVANTDWATAASKLSDIALGMLRGINAAIKTVDWFTIGKSVSIFLKNIKWSEAVNAIAEGFGAVAGGLAALLWGCISDPWSEVVQWWKDTAYEDGQFTLEGLLTGILEKVKDIGTWIVDNIFKPFVDGFKSAFGIHSPSTEMKPFGIYIIEGMYSGITETIKSVETWIQENIFDKFKEKFTSVFGTDKGASSKFTDIGKNVIEGFKDGASEIITNVKDWLTTNIFNPFKEKFGSVFGTDEGDGHSKSFGEFGLGIIEGLKDGITDALKNIGQWVTDNVLTPIKTAMSTAWDGIKTWWSGLELPSKKIDANVSTNTGGGKKSKKYASGGFPKVGEFFYARENGPELVGTMGNRPAVANNSQIVEGIAQGVYDAVVAAQGSGGERSYSFNLYLDGRQISAAIKKAEKNSGMDIYGGGVTVGI